MLSTKVVDFRNQVDESMQKESVSFKDYIEEALKISQSDYTTLSTLKFHIELEDAPERDDALKFLNLLQDCYDGRNLDISVISGIQDLYLGKFSGNTSFNTLTMLMQNAGISIGVVTEAWFEDDYLKQVTSSVVQNKDGSFSGKINSYDDLKNYINIVCKKYSYAMSAKRQQELHIKIEFLAEMDYSIPIIVCFANVSNGVAKYTIFNTENQEKLTDKPLMLFQNTEYKEVVYDTWVL